MLTNRDVVLMSVLECGTLDFSVLDDVEYEIDEIIDEFLDYGEKPTLNRIMHRVFAMGEEELGQKVKERISELEQIQYDCGLEEDEEEELSELKLLNVEDDIDWYCNCLDTSIWFEKNGEIYRKYLPDAVEAVEKNMGHDFAS